MEAVFPLGTDNSGRDLLTRHAHRGRVRLPLPSAGIVPWRLAFSMAQPPSFIGGKTEET